METRIDLDEFPPRGELRIALRPGMAWLLYWDDGPSGPGGQSMRHTRQHASLHVFECEDDMRKAAAHGVGRNAKARRMCGVVGEWTDSGVMSVTIHGKDGA